MREEQKLAATTGSAISISALASFIGLAHEIRYFDGTELLATDRFERITVSTSEDRVATAAQ